MYCTNCGNEVSEKAIACTGCGVPPCSGERFCSNCGSGVNANQVMCVKCGVSLSGGSIRNGTKKTTAGLLAIFLGAFGIHKFYHGSWGWGIIYILFFLTYIPGLAGLIEGIVYLTMDAAKYDAKYNSGQKSPFKW